MNLGIREPLRPKEKWFIGGPGVSGGADQVYATEDGVEWTQKSAHVWKKRYFLLKGTSLFWFKSCEAGCEPSGAINLNALCTVKQATVTSRRRKQCIEITSPLLKGDDVLLLSFATERRCKVWLTELKTAIRRRTEGFSRYTMTKGYKNSVAWVPIKELLDLRASESIAEKKANNNNKLEE